MAQAFTAYAITEGGLLRRVEGALRITKGDDLDWLQRAIALVTITCVPSLVLSLAWGLLAGEWFPALSLVQTYVRPFVSVPLLFAAEPLVEARARAAGQYLVESGIARSSPDDCRQAVARTARLRDSMVAEGALLAIAVASPLLGTSALRGSVSPFWWGSLPLIILFRFLIFRWLWRWLLWTLYLRWLARAPLALHATHPDRVAGLGPLLGPSHASAFIAAAASATVAAGIADTMMLDGVPLSGFADVAATFVVLAVLLALMPGFVFVPHLYDARKYGLRRYGAFSHRFARAFEARWFGARGEDGLSAQDISSLCDLGGSFSVVTEVRVFAWSRRVVVAVALGAVLPMVPLVLMHIGFSDLVVRIAKNLL